MTVPAVFLACALLVAVVRGQACESITDCATCNAQMGNDQYGRGPFKGRCGWWYVCGAFAAAAARRIS